MSAPVERRIRELAAELEPVRPLPRLRSLTALAAALWLAGVGIEWMLGGPRPLAEGRPWSPALLAALLGVAALAGGGVAGALASAVPGREALARAGLGVALAGLGLLGLAGLGLSAGAEPAAIAAVPWLCIGRTAWLALLPAAALLAFAARAWLPRPSITAAAAWLGAVGLGAVAVQLSCREAGVFHVLFGHAGGPLLLAAALALPAAIWLRRRAARA